MTILAKNNVTLNNLPHVADINTLLKLLSNLGASFHREDSLQQ
jgi:UDP-N-acetylglucosamine 1-carboxyvinyltransferase